MKRTKALEKEMRLRTKHLDELIKLRSELSDIAIKKAETSINERQEMSNNKYALLKEQASEFATRKEVETLTKLVYIGVGMILIIEVALRFIK